MSMRPEIIDEKARRREYNRAYYSTNKEAIHAQRRLRCEFHGMKPRAKKRSPLTALQREKNKARCRAYYSANRDALVKKSQQWRAANADRVRETSRKYGRLNRQRQMQEMLQDPERRRHYYKRLWEWQKAKAANNPSFAIYQRVMMRMSRALKNHLAGRRVTSQSKIVRLLGCDWSDFISHIESKFQPGMTWQNHGRSGWHFDHIRPLSSFDLTDETQLSAGCHFTNVQPLWAADNVRKAGKIA